MQSNNSTSTKNDTNMKTKSRMLLASFTVIAGLVLLFTALALPGRLAAQHNQGANQKHHHYKLIDIGTFGGPESFVPETIEFVNANGDLNKRGLVVGGSATSIPTTGTSNFLVCGGISGTVPFVFHGFGWHNGVVTDLGALPGAGNCSTVAGVNEIGKIIGGSENGEIDPLTGINQIRAVSWIDGEITDLGSFGGNQNGATGINSHGQVVGFSLNTIPDQYSVIDFLLVGVPNNGTQTRAFLWQDGVMRDLGTLGGPDAIAYLVNERGQIAGQSYTNDTPNPVTGLPTFDPFLWENGKMIDLGTLGGTYGFPLALNNRGQVVGTSNLAGDNTAHAFLWDRGRLTDLGTLGGDFSNANAINEAGEVVGYSSPAGDQSVHAFLWRNGVMADLGTVDGDPCSTANAINSRSQVVGISTATCDFSTGRRAFLWENGSMVDLNTLIPPGSSFQLTLAETINDRGEIAGNGTPQGCGVVEECGHAFLLIPCDEHHPGVEGCDYSLVEAPAAVSQTSPAIRDASSRTLPLSLLRRMSRYRFPGRAFGPKD
jgi:probable HAF family extracellular repeat protein